MDNVTDPDAQLILDPPDPALPVEQQRPAIQPPAVPVRVDSIVRVQIIPNRVGPAGNTFLSRTQPVQILGRDLLRARALLWSTSAWYYSRASGQKAAVAANMVISITHGDEVCGSVAAGQTAEVQYITEQYGE